MRVRTNRGIHHAGSYPVGATVELVPYKIVGTIVDLVLDEDLQDIRYVVVAFDGGPAEPILYLPVRATLLHPKLHQQFSVNAADDAIETHVPSALAAPPVVYGGNTRRGLKAFAPTPLSFRLH
jgi:hypothetical protein